MDELRNPQDQDEYLSLQQTSNQRPQHTLTSNAHENKEGYPCEAENFCSGVTKISTISNSCARSSISDINANSGIVSHSISEAIICNIHISTNGPKKNDHEGSVPNYVEQRLESNINSRQDELIEIVRQKYLKPEWFDSGTFVWPTIVQQQSTDCQTIDLALRLEIICAEQIKKSNHITSIFILEGVPGCGKSTCVKKIAFDWANKTILQHYALLIIIDFSTLQKSSYVSLKEFICEGFALTFSTSLNYDVFSKEKTLIIIDGYSTGLSQTECQELTKLLHNHFNHQTPFDLLLTKRQDRFLPSISCKGRRKEFFKILGFTDQDQRNDYISRLECSEEMKSEIHLKLKKEPSLEKIAAIPYLLSLICEIPERATTGRISELYTLMCKKLASNYQFECQENVPKLLGFENEATDLNQRLHAIEENFLNFDVLQRLGHYSLKHITDKNISTDFLNWKDSDSKIVCAIRLMRSTPEQSGRPVVPSLEFPHITLRDYFAALFYCNWNKNVYSDDGVFQREKMLESFIWEMVYDELQREEHCTGRFVLLRNSLSQFFCCRTLRAIDLSNEDCETVECFGKLLKDCINVEQVTIAGRASETKTCFNLINNNKLSSLVCTSIQFTSSTSSFIFPSATNTNLSVRFVSCTFTADCFDALTEEIRKATLHELAFIDFDLNSINASKKRNLTSSDCGLRVLKKLEFIWTNAISNWQLQPLNNAVSHFAFASKLLIKCSSSAVYDITLPVMPNLVRLTLEKLNVHENCSKLRIAEILDPAPEAVCCLRIKLHMCHFSKEAWENFIRAFWERHTGTGRKVDRLGLHHCTIENDKIDNFTDNILSTIRNNGPWMKELALVTSV